MSAPPTTEKTATDWCCASMCCPATNTKCDRWSVDITGSSSSLSDLTRRGLRARIATTDSQPPSGCRMPNFRPTDRLTSFLMPPSVDEWLPQRHLARFVVEVIDDLDLSVMSKSYRGSGSAS